MTVSYIYRNLEPGAKGAGKGKGVMKAKVDNGDNYEDADWLDVWDDMGVEDKDNMVEGVKGLAASLIERHPAIAIAVRSPTSKMNGCDHATRGAH